MLAVVIIFCLAIHNLYYELTHVESNVAKGLDPRHATPEKAAESLQKIGEHIRQTPKSQWAWAIVLTVISYLILVGYDMLAMAFVNQKLPLWKIAMASFVGYSFSYNFGATLSGGPIRFRLYAGWKVPLGRIVELLVILGLTFWFGLFFLGGTLLTLLANPHLVKNPLTIPADVLAKFQTNPVSSFVAGHLESHLCGVGVTLLLTALVYLTASFYFHGHIRLFGKQIPVPAFRLTLYQYAIASADFIVAAAVMYVVLPPDTLALLPQHLAARFAYVLAAYILAYVAEVITHVPGGYGVFDYLLCKLLPGHFLANFAAVLVFRIIYRLVPVVIGAVLFALNEVALRREALLGLGRMVLHHEKKDEG